MTTAERGAADMPAHPGAARMPRWPHMPQAIPEASSQHGYPPQQQLPLGAYAGGPHPSTGWRGLEDPSGHPPHFAGGPLATALPSMPESQPYDAQQLAGAHGFGFGGGGNRDLRAQHAFGALFATNLVCAMCSMCPASRVASCLRACV